MRICIDAHVLGDKSGGNETYYRNIIDNIHKFMKQDDEIILLMSSKKEAERINKKNIRNIKTVFFKSKNPIIRYLYEIPKLVRKYKADVLHTQYYAPLIKNCKLVVTIHDISYEHFPEYFKKLELIRNRVWIWYSSKISDIILTVSEYSKKDISEIYKINKDKIVVTHLATSEIYKQVDEKLVEETKEKFGIKGNYLLTVGNLQPRKNMVRLINSYTEIKSNNPEFNLKLVIVGKKAWKFDGIFKTVNSANLNDEVILTDYVSDYELVNLYNGAEIFIYPSIFEGFGLPVIEAMACGTPVITSNLSSLPEVAGDAAALINPFDNNDIINTLEKVYFDEGYKNILIKKGLKRFKEFSWNKTSSKVIDVYRQVIGEGF